MIDLNNDGKIDYKEFITASFNHAEVLNKKNLNVIFDIIDTNHDKHLSIDEL